jgi:hypothetical protein
MSTSQCAPALQPRLSRIVVSTTASDLSVRTVALPQRPGGLREVPSSATLPRAGRSHGFLQLLDHFGYAPHGDERAIYIPGGLAALEQSVMPGENAEFCA